MTVDIRPPDQDRIEELVAQNEYQGGGDFVRVCRPRQTTIPAHLTNRSQEALDDPKPRETVEPKAQIIQTCSCGQAAVMEIAYRQPSGRKATYKACAVCDALERQPRFDGAYETTRRSEEEEA